MYEQIKVILFDQDDTLLKTLENIGAAIIDAADELFHLTLTTEDVLKPWGKPFDTYMKEVFGGIDDETYQRILPRYLEIRDKHPNMAYEGTVEAIKQLLPHYIVGIVTSTSKITAMRDLTRNGFPVQEFIHIQTAEDTTVHKPHPDVFLPILSRLAEKNIKANEVLYVGDSLSDFHAAAAAGMYFIGICNRTTKRKDFLQAFKEKKYAHAQVVGTIQEIVVTLVGD